MTIKDISSQRYCIHTVQEKLQFVGATATPCITPGVWTENARFRKLGGLDSRYFSWPALLRKTGCLLKKKQELVKPENFQSKRYRKAVLMLRQN